MEPLSPSSKKIKKSHLKIVLIFLEMKLSSSNIEKFFIISQRKAFLVFQENELPKNSLYCRKWNPLKSSYITGSTFSRSKT